MSNTTTTIPVSVCIEGIESKVLAQHSDWELATDAQKEFFAKTTTDLSDCALLKEGEIAFKVSKSADEINAFLAEKKFNIKLDPFVDPRDFGVASVLDVSVEWVEPADEGRLTHNGVDYPSVEMTDNITFLEGPFGQAVAKIATKSGDEVFVSIAHEALSGFTLKEAVAQIVGSTKRIYDFGGLAMPMVHLDQEEDISFLVGMTICGEDGNGIGTVSQALQQTRFRLNQFGARVESAAAMGMCYESCMQRNPPLVIDKPFFLAVHRPGAAQPLFSAYVTPEDWKDPGSLA